MKTVYYTASSLDGFIVDTEDSLDWLISRNIDQQGPFGYDEFIKTIGALAMGSATYEWIVKNHPEEWGYDQPTWMLTIGRRSSPPSIRCRCSPEMSLSCTRSWSKLRRERMCGWSAEATSPPSSSRAG